MTDVSDQVGFGECEGCGFAVERVGWDRLCFACQQEELDDEAERNWLLTEEDEYLYGVGFP